MSAHGGGAVRRTPTRVPVAAPEAAEASLGRPAAAAAARPRHAVAPEEAVAEAALPGAPEDRPAPARPPRLAAPVPSVAVGLGGALGALARFGVGAWAADRWGAAFPWGTLLINASGSLLLGFYLTLATERFAGRATTRLFVATGFCGAFTTMSALSYEAVALAQRGAAPVALAYVAASLALGLAAVLAGVVAARAW